ncbi:MAG: IS1182 family transposase [Tolypothrix carrinoi HA7290-LM1]|jgi:transposase|nr:IS1182 family transposase [Tolypothrix carrinoi HA7290-LM1]
MIQLQEIDPIPEETARIARLAFPKGNTCIKMRDSIGTIFCDKDFEALFSTQGQPAFSPWRLALVCVLQYINDMTDRQAADAVRGRIDWKYALSLELTDPGFDFSVLCEFRGRLIAGGVEQKLLDILLKQLQEKGIIKDKGKQRTDSTHVLAAVRNLNRLENVAETLRAALNAVATVASDWLLSWVPNEWFERYGRAVDEYRLPKGIEARYSLAETIGNDGMQLLISIYESSTTPQWLRQIPAIEILRQTWLHQYYIDYTDVPLDTIGKLRWRNAADLPKAGDRFDSPYDTDARYANKRSTTWTGYKVHITETCDANDVHLITNVETTQAQFSDVDQTEAIHLSLESKGLSPREHIVDAGYVDSELLIKSQIDFDIELIGPVRPNVSWQAKTPGGYDISKFTVDWEAKTVTCPQGQKSTTWTPAIDNWGNSGINVKFPSKVCRRCDFRHLCIKSKSESEPRKLRLRPEEEHQIIQTIRSAQDTDEWKERYNTRAGVEGTLSQGINAFGLRQARYRNLPKVRLQHIITAVAINVVRTVSWLDGIPHAATRISRFAALAAT